MTTTISQESSGPPLEPDLELGLRDDRLLGVGLRVRLLERLADRRELGLGLGERHAGLEAALHDQVAEVTRGERIDVREADHARPHGQRYERRFAEVRVQAGEGLWRHADDRELDAGDLDRPPDDRRVGGELLLPGRMAEHGDGVSTGDAILLRQEPATDRRRRRRACEK